MINYNSAAALRAFLDSEGLGMQKKFGQNFLINPKIRQSLVDALDGAPGCEVWEIGPGIGAMTALLLEEGMKGKAFEIDKGFIGILKRIFDNEKNFTIVEGDVMKTWMKTWQMQKSACAENNNDYLFGNLPYNIGATLLAQLIEKGCLFKRMVVTVQKEVALRMAATAGSKDYSSFSVLCASVYRVKPLMTIRREAFYPQPNVESMGVLLETLHEGSCEIPSGFYPLVRALFASRRKTIRNNLTAFVHSCADKFPSGAGVKEITETVLKQNGFNGNERAEDLEIEQFLSLANSVQNMRK
ncbi:MAG: 16S rRNA (adenine(1518)-N(6)/adenine(1519)-N(6))-dimethyltransferase RsmA [Treponema sp.]|jgi:16S rRNA (adenine1518-N6/adenine1519-N6)-dimethyltransferase|nr:16S rRNA (adenine(1518)-N(6)/adenine(1519)-N(6))-dimethyltransferase RsmA [Treponema sp.]